MHLYKYIFLWYQIPVSAIHVGYVFVWLSLLVFFVLIKINFYSVILENGIKLNLSVTDTPGFGDQIDNNNW